MAYKKTKRLDGGDPFPRMELQLVDGGTMPLPDGLGGGWGVILAYRGHW
jgi:hypothetical protein